MFIIIFFKTYTYRETTFIQDTCNCFYIHVMWIIIII